MAERALLLVHLVAAVAMAAPLYMLIVVGERARFDRPLNYATDRYLENIIGRNAPRCFVYQATILGTGLALVRLDSGGYSRLWEQWEMAAKFGALAALVVLLSLVHFGIQPRIERLLARVPEEGPAPDGIAPELAGLRTVRKQLSAVCLFLVLGGVIFGVRLMARLELSLAIGFLVGAALFAWRAYRTRVRAGWV